MLELIYFIYPIQGVFMKTPTNTQINKNLDEQRVDRLFPTDLIYPNECIDLEDVVWLMSCGSQHSCFGEVNTLRPLQLLIEDTCL